MVPVTKEYGFSTQQIHAGHLKNSAGALTSPIYQSSTFVFDNAQQGANRFAGEEDGFIYTRLGNPTEQEIELKLAALEGAEAALFTASGMGAISATMHTFLQSGDHVISSEVVYGCTHALFDEGLRKYGIDFAFVDTTKTDAIVKNIKPNTKMIYIETPANPTLDISDIQAIAAIAHEHDLLFVVDNTFCTPYLQRPIELGADLAVYSATKYINGHGDVVAGAGTGKQDMIDQIRMVGLKDMTGSVISPFDAFLVNRGMKTLSLRMDRHVQNAQKIVEFLESEAKVQQIFYPGNPNFAGYAVAQQQMSQPGAMIAFDLKGGRAAGEKFINSVELMSLAVSLGDAETLIEHPASMTHSTYSEADLKQAGISQGLIRVSAGLEDAADLINDMAQAFAKLDTVIPVS
ncbi:cystathionine gamma-synthase [Agrilactobacillus composti DSM 18527 = JCM 14202]|uniref:L-methionine gamma-lyase n=1 Tax=Agrilactobacillus composti DSM 18527 = JCM 14202 TaxID=1423734 RepID=A0A0R1Y1J1_9LACO|nr:cystathionine gamma-synthase [Agrilactobacillus composti DSM 18527 = JCM 14202]